MNLWQKIRNAWRGETAPAPETPPRRPVAERYPDPLAGTKYDPARYSRPAPPVSARHELRTPPVVASARRGPDSSRETEERLRRRREEELRSRAYPDETPAIAAGLTGDLLRSDSYDEPRCAPESSWGGGSSSHDSGSSSHGGSSSYDSGSSSSYDSGSSSSCD